MELEYTAPGDPYYDFCLWEYEPAAPQEDKIRSVNLLFQSFAVAALDQKAFRLVESLRQGIGVFNTVYGVKQIGGRLAWEFYFYDYRRRNRERSIASVLRAIRPFAPCSVRPNENLNYFMFSLDIDQDLLVGNREIEEMHMYIGAPGSTVSSAFCFAISPGGTRLENYYFFYRSEQIQEIMNKIAGSAQVDTSVIDMNNIIWPQLRDCEIIVIANKQQNDAIYFSRIKVDQLIFFMKTLRYPQLLIDFIEQNREKLNHLLYDVGFDYRMEGRDLVILKSGYYGVF